MSTQLSDAQDRRETGNGYASIDLEEQLRPVLQAMLVGIRRHRETPLLAAFDSHGIVAAALHSLSNGFPKVELDELPDWNVVTTVLNYLVQQSLTDEPQHGRAGTCMPRGAQGDDASQMAHQLQEDAPHPLVVWLEHFYTVIREVHPKGIEVVMLCLEGCDSREVARQLELPWRLCKRVIHDVQQAWEGATEKM
jgi:hypothetical protein